MLELSRELGQHNILLEKALEKHNRLMLKVQRVEDHIMNKEIYNYAKVEAYIESERKSDKEKMAQQRQSFS